MEQIQQTQTQPQPQTQTQPQPLPVPSLTPENVKWIIDYIDNEVPTKYGRVIQGFIQNIAIENARNEPKVGIINP